jgi:Ca2+-binding EF-hand superfamily protein
VAARIKPKLSDLRAEFTRRDKGKRGRLRNDEVKAILEDFDVSMGGQEWITLQRRFQFADSDTFLYNDFVAYLE